MPPFSWSSENLTWFVYSVELSINSFINSWNNAFSVLIHIPFCGTSPLNGHQVGTLPVLSSGHMFCCNYGRNVHLGVQTCSFNSPSSEVGVWLPDACQQQWQKGEVRRKPPLPYSLLLKCPIIGSTLSIWLEDEEVSSVSNSMVLVLQITCDM